MAGILNFKEESDAKTGEQTIMKPILGITMGDICGIGPEITVKALLHKETYAMCRPVVIGSAKAVCRALQAIGRDADIHMVEDIQEAVFACGTIDVWDIPAGDPLPPYGQETAQGGKAAYEAIEAAIRLAMAGKIDAVITGPLNKAALHLAGYPYSGHTEIFAEQTGTKKYAMMLADGNLRVVHVSTHVSLREACDRVKKDRVLETITLAQNACRNLGIERPRIAVAGLNPHCGEGGLFGREEIEEISPAIAAAREKGWDVTGPVPPDTVFSKARGGMFDIVVAMYHDQGHIPLKLAGFSYNEEKKSFTSVSGVNITLGLPIIRASVDHGTGFDLAGRGTASEESLQNAMEYGVRLANTRKRAAQEDGAC